jgi:hypothetical protein
MIRAQQTLACAQGCGNLVDGSLLQGVHNKEGRPAGALSYLLDD